MVFLLIKNLSTYSCNQEFILAIMYSRNTDRQGRSQAKGDGGASQLQLTWPTTNLYAICQ